MPSARRLAPVLVASALLAVSSGVVAASNIPGTEPTMESDNVLTQLGPRVDGVAPSVLYAPSNPDNPAYRAAIAAFTGGAVDYFDASLATPSPAVMSGYTVVYTWANNPYFDRVGFGNALADYVDAGGKVLLGAFCTYTSGASLGGRIMTAGYCPVTSPAGTNHFATSNYAGDGTSYQHRNVGFYQDTYRDFLVLQGLSVLDGRWNDFEIATAHRQDGKVMYMNAAGPSAFGAGDFARIVANFAQWTFLGGSLFAASEAGALYGMNLRTGKGTLVGPLPLSPVADADYDETTGAAYCSAGAFGNRVHGFAIGTGAPVGGIVGTPGGTYTALETIGGGWWGCSSAFACGPSSIALFNPATGAVISGPTATGVGTIAGMSFNAGLGRMYYVTDFDCGLSELYWNIAPGNPLNGLGSVGFVAGAIEWGPDDNLYGVNVSANSKLYRINPTTGISSQIGTLTGLGALTGLMRVSGAQAVDAGPWESPALEGLALASPLPNPSPRGAQITLRFALPASGGATLTLYDIVGRRVWTRVEAALPAGEHAFVWDGRDASGVAARAGIYVVRLETEQGGRSAKLLRL